MASRIYGCQNMRISVQLRTGSWALGKSYYVHVCFGEQHNLVERPKMYFLSMWKKWWSGHTEYPAFWLADIRQNQYGIRCIPSIDPCHPENLVSLCNRVLKIRITRRKIFQTLQFFWLFWETRGVCVCGMCVDFPEVKTANQRPAWVPEMRDQPHHSTISPDKRDMTHYGICFMHDDIQNIQHTL